MWGVATSAYQIEGAIADGGREPSEWDEYSRLPGTILGGDTAETAIDHYHRFAEDISLMAGLGVDAYRFSFSWTRVVRSDGTVNTAGIDFYNRLVDALLSAGVTPFATINHMELPARIARKGGWANRDTISAFVDYARIVHEHFGDRIGWWTTLNEVPLTTWNGYATNSFPPRANRPDLGLPAIHHQFLAHGLATAEMRAQRSEGRFGIVGSIAPIRALSSRDPLDVAAAERVDAIMNLSGIDPIICGKYPELAMEFHHRCGGKEFIKDGDADILITPIDFFGVNYYSPLYVAHDPKDKGGGRIPAGLFARSVVPSELPTTSFGWSIEPAALADGLRRLGANFPVPIIITENGAAFADRRDAAGAIHDTDRIAYLRDHIAVIDGAIADGIDVRGYFVWSLVDNFEWAAGYSQRFGLIHVDYTTLERTAKDSYYWYRNLISRRRV